MILRYLLFLENNTKAANITGAVIKYRQFKAYNNCFFLSEIIWPHGTPSFIVPLLLIAPS